MSYSEHTYGPFLLVTMLEGNYTCFSVCLLVNALGTFISNWIIVFKLLFKKVLCTIHIACYAVIIDSYISVDFILSHCIYSFHGWTFTYHQMKWAAVITHSNVLQVNHIQYVRSLYYFRLITSPWEKVLDNEYGKVVLKPPSLGHNSRMWCP